MKGWPAHQADLVMDWANVTKQPEGWTACCCGACTGALSAMSVPVNLQVEMWLVAPYDVRIPGTGIVIKQGERLLMEVSRKFTQPHLRGLALEAGWCWQV